MKLLFITKLFYTLLFLAVISLITSIYYEIFELSEYLLKDTFRYVPINHFQLKFILTAYGIFFFLFLLSWIIWHCIYKRNQSIFNNKINKSVLKKYKDILWLRDFSKFGFCFVLMNMILSIIIYSYIGGDDLKSAVSLSYFIYIVVLLTQFIYLYYSLPTILLIKVFSKRKNTNNLFLKYILSFNINFLSRLNFSLFYAFNIIFTVFIVLLSTNDLDIDIKISIWSWTTIYGSLSLKIWWTKLKDFISSYFNKFGYNMIYTNIDRWVKLTLNLYNSNISEKIFSDYKCSLESITAQINRIILNHTNKKIKLLSFEIQKYLKLLRILKDKRDILLVSGILLFYIFEYLDKKNLTFTIYNYEKRISMFYYLKVASNNKSIVYDSTKLDNANNKDTDIIMGSFRHTIFKNNKQLNSQNESLKLGYTASPYLAKFEFVIILWELISLIDENLYIWDIESFSTCFNDKDIYVKFDEKKWYYYWTFYNKNERKVFKEKFEFMKLEIKYDIFIDIIFNALKNTPSLEWFSNSNIDINN